MKWEKERKEGRKDCTINKNKSETIVNSESQNQLSLSSTVDSFKLSITVAFRKSNGSTLIFENKSKYKIKNKVTCGSLRVS